MSPTRSRRVASLLPVLVLPAAALALGESVSASAPPSVPDDTAPLESLPEGYVRLVDDLGFLTVVVPDSWTEVSTAPAPGADGTTPQPLILASTVGFDDFNATFTSGVLYTAVPFEADAQAYLEGNGLSAGCESIATEPYSDAVFTGFVQVGENCGEAREATWNMIVASPADESFTVVVQLQIDSDDEQEAFDTVLATFTYVGGPEVPGGLVPSSVPGSSAPG